jgi:hypothetical protein
MADFKNYFKFPLKMWECMDIKVFTDDNKMAFDWMINATREVKQTLIDVINGTTLAKQANPKKFWHDSGIIWCRFLSGENEGKEIKICRIRGWGGLTGVGGYNLDSKTAAKIQDDFAEYCVKMLNGNE